MYEYFGLKYRFHEHFNQIGLAAFALALISPHIDNNNNIHTDIDSFWALKTSKQTFPFKKSS